MRRYPLFPCPANQIVSQGGEKVGEGKPSETSAKDSVEKEAMEISTLFTEQQDIDTVLTEIQEIENTVTEQDIGSIVKLRIVNVPGFTENKGNEKTIKLADDGENIYSNIDLRRHD